MRDYNRFLNSILENPLLRSSDIVEEFITKNQNDFHIIKLKYKNIQKKVIMEDFLSLNGELDATYYQDKYALTLNIPKIIEKKKNLYLNLNNALKEVINEFEIMDSKMNNLSEAFHNLSNEYKNNDGGRARAAAGDLPPPAARNGGALSGLPSVMPPF